MRKASHIDGLGLLLIHIQQTAEGHKRCHNLCRRKWESIMQIKKIDNTNCVELTHSPNNQAQ